MAQGSIRQGGGRQQPGMLLIQLWRLLVLSSAAVGLTWVLLEKGWWLETPDQVVFHGAVQQDHGELFAASALELPIPLLAVDASSIQQHLRRLVSPTLQVQVQRILAPPQLVVRLQNSTAQSWARRSVASGVEHGLLDHRFNWTSFDVQDQLDTFPVVKNNVLVLVDFWTPGLQDTLAELFTGLEYLETPVSTIRITADGQLVLHTSEVLGEVRLGQPDSLERKLATMDHLYLQLAGNVPPFSYTYVDLRNPDQPNVGLSQGVPDSS